MLRKSPAVLFSAQGAYSSWAFNKLISYRQIMVRLDGQAMLALKLERSMRRHHFGEKLA
jgi:hypothetical protein